MSKYFLFISLILLNYIFISCSKDIELESKVNSVLLGDAIHASFEFELNKDSTRSICTNVILEDFMDELASEIQADPAFLYPDQDFYFHIISTDLSERPIAFASAGGHIYLNKPFLRNLSFEGSLALSMVQLMYCSALNYPLDVLQDSLGFNLISDFASGGSQQQLKSVLNILIDGAYSSTQLVDLDDKLRDYACSSRFRRNDFGDLLYNCVTFGYGYSNIQYCTLFPYSENRKLIDYWTDNNIENCVKGSNRDTEFNAFRNSLY